MKRFEFKLQKVLAVRRIREKIAEIELGRARTRLALEQEHQALLGAKIRKNLEEYTGVLRATFEPARVIDYQVYTERLHAEAEAQAAKVEAALAEFERRQTMLFKARQERKALDRLRERHQQEHVHQVLLEEQKVLDDMAMRR